ncbi:MAG: TonB family protein [Acidobacteriia bacterium]|nr:TonB family protein [Terriglobia bacterium]
MQPVIPPEAPPLADYLVELPPHARLPRLDLAIDWESPRREFWSSVRANVAGPRPPKYGELAESRGFRVEWVRGKPPGRAFLASCLWHIAVVWILILPIWGFLPQNTPTLAPVQIELTWYGEPKDLPPITLHAAPAKPAAAPKKPEDAPKPPDDRGADAFHPRQTILSIPVRVTHPRQTLIRPDAPPAPPKILTPLPNIVQWSAVEIARPHLQLAPTDSAPRIQKRAVRDVAAPEAPNLEKNTGPLNIAPSPTAIPRPRITLNAMSAPVIERHQAKADAGPAPEVGAAAAEGDANLRRLIALSATPAPPAPQVNVPEGNLAARISLSPEGMKPGAPGDMANSSASASAGAKGNSRSAPGTIGTGEAGGAGSLPAAVSISPGIARGGGGGITPAARRPGGLILKPTTPYEPATNTRRGPANVAAIDPSLPPEKIFSGKEVYTLHVNLPNLTSASGSWVLNFAELDEEIGPPFRHKEQVAGPVPIEKADPKYPQELIKGHVHGEVVLYAIIRKDGSVDSIQVVRGLDPQLDRNAIDALAQWKFRPGTRAGVPVDLEAVVHIPFTYIDPRDYGPR